MAKNVKFYLKPENKKVILDVKSTKVKDIFNSRFHTASLTKTGKPIGPDEKLLQDLDLVENDFLWKIEKPDFLLLDFLEYLYEDLEKFGKSEKVDILLNFNKNSVTEKTGTFEFSFDSTRKDNQIETGTLIISNNRGNLLNIVIEIGDMTECLQKPLSYRSLEETSYFLRSYISQYLPNPTVGLASLPNAVISKILVKLDFKSLLNIGMTNKRFHALENTDIVWEKLWYRDFHSMNILTDQEYIDHPVPKKRYLFAQKRLEDRRQNYRENRGRSDNERYPRPVDPFYPAGPGPTYPYPNRPNNPGEFPGMIGGISDLDPFGVVNPINPMRNPANTGIRPRGDPHIFGPGGNIMPGRGGGLGSDDIPYGHGNLGDEIYQHPSNPLFRRGNNRGRGPPGPGFGGGFGF